MVKRKALFFSLILLSAFHFSYGQEKWSLDKCIAYAQQNNIQIKQSELTTIGANENYLQSKLNLLPTLNGQAQYGLNHGRTIDPTSNLFVDEQIQSGSFSLSASVKLFGGFTKINQIRQKYADFMSSKYTTEQAVNNISLSVANAYLQILFTQEQLNNATAQKKLSDQEADRTQKMVDAGVLSLGSLYNIQAQVANDELSQVTAQNQFDLAELNLQQLLNLDKPIDIDVPELNISAMEAANFPTLDEIFNQALVTQPQIKSAQFQLVSSQKSLLESKGGLYPSLSLFASLSTNYSTAYQQVNPNSISYDTVTIGYVVPALSRVVGLEPVYTLENTPFSSQIKNNYGQGIGLSLSVPLFNGWQTRNLIAQTKLNVLNAQYGLDLAKQNLKKDVQTAYTDALASKNKYAAAIKTEASSELSFNYAQQKYDVGLMNSVDYITTQNTLITAKSNMLQSKFDYIFRMKVLDFYLGKPINLP